MSDNRGQTTAQIGAAPARPSPWFSRIVNFVYGVSFAVIFAVYVETITHVGAKDGGHLNASVFLASTGVLLISMIAADTLLEKYLGGYRHNRFLQAAGVAVAGYNFIGLDRPAYMRTE